MPMHGKGARIAAYKRRAEYFRLRREGFPKWDAAGLLGLERETTCRYERWWKAIQAGQVQEPEIPGKGNSDEQDQELPGRVPVHRGVGCADGFPRVLHP
jgi:hypothetical protein